MNTPTLSLLKGFYKGAVVSLLLLIFLGLTWELWLAPLRPGGSLMALKVVPLLLSLRGVLRRDVYTMQWTSMLILLYFTEGIVRATSDHGLSVPLAWLEVVLALIYFVCVIGYLRPYKKVAKQEAKKMTKQRTG